MNDTSLNQAVQFVSDVKQHVQRDIMGQTSVIDGLIVGLLSGGHVLLEGNPGLGKTMLANRFAVALGLGPASFGRIQFTPDLLPSDITGTYAPDFKNDKRAFSFQKGPIFKQILLADEINRATPKTQAAMLEAMAEKQVTVMGETHRLVEEETYTLHSQPVKYLTPFMVIGTQNPIDQEGTYDLPEAQADRFQMKILMENNDTKTLLRIIAREALGERDDPPAQSSAPLPHLGVASPLSMYRIHAIRSLVLTLPVPKVVLEHVANIIQATNPSLHSDEIVNLGQRNRRALTEFVETFIEAPLGPRAARDLVLAAKVKALILTPVEGVEKWQGALPSALSVVAPSVLRHRLKLKFDWPQQARKQFSSLAGEKNIERLRDRVVARLLELSAPEGSSTANGYTGFFRRSGTD